MELDEMKAAWQLLDRRLEQQTNSARLTRTLSPLRRGQVIQIIAGAVPMLLAGNFWAEHRTTLHLLLPGLMLHLYGLMMVISAARTLHLLSRIDYAAPLLQIQHQLGRLQLWRARIEQPFFAVVGCFIWIPLILIIFNALGADLWITARAVVYWFIFSGFLCLGIAYGVKRWLPKATIENSFAGRAIRNARQQMDQLSQFEQE
jgi:hypothetical protein